MVGIMLRYMNGFGISMLEGRYMVYFVGSFDGTKDNVGGTCVGI